jgi:hypothetical protein
MKDREPGSDREKSPPPTVAEREAGKEEAGAPPKPRYEFKILPVDPKNSFDFEDVADK